ncbi:LYR motif-containing protein 4 [Mactra antiquata]
MAVPKSQILSLYKRLLREAKKFNTYNFRLYAVEKIQYEFHTNKSVTEPEKLSALMKKGQENLDMIKRQVMMGQMYGEGRLVIENPASDNKT